MGLADIQEKQSEERKREKRLVHVTNALSRDFLGSGHVRGKTKTYKDTAEYVTKSLLDYLFFEQRKELREINKDHVETFMLDFAPRKMRFATATAKNVPDIMETFLTFLETDGHINNGIELSATAKSKSRAFLKLMSREKITRKKTVKKATSQKKSPKKIAPEVKVGRNDPCPCGSGKKYKKCCSRTT
jgi:preprotein translocase subunit SecA